ncbi:MAG: PorP/SprF family type IX secretion system membrane protein [Chitinophagales bacterium]|nr:PorP/SprF family type IX secretion system membrane protein [Chitinophagales bacterium]
MRLLLPLFLLASLTLSAQDLHFSQFYLHPIYQNPANTGLYKGTLRAGGIYRTQWTSIPVSFTTFGAFCDVKIQRRGNYMMAGGLMLEHDQAGLAALTWNRVAGTFSVGHALGTTQAIVVGFGVGGAQRAFNINKLRFKNQWNGAEFDPSADAKESFNRSSGLAPSLSAGVQWRFQAEEKRTALGLGAGINHFNRPKINFRDDAPLRLPLRLDIQADARLQMTSGTDLLAFGLLRRMGKAAETLAGIGVRQILTSGPANETAISLSIASRFGDALIPALQVERNNWLLGVSYDLNTSDLNRASAGQGALEIGINYRIIPAPPVKTFKSCPIF